MGRGRQKAKHMKVARRLKYYSPDTDLSALQAELAGGEDPLLTYGSEESDDQEDDDYASTWRYAAWVDEHEDEED